MTSRHQIQDRAIVKAEAPPQWTGHEFSKIKLIPTQC